MKSIITFLFAVAIFVMVGCAAGPNAMEGVGANVAGFWLGLWHGLIVGITFIVSWFTDSVTIYEVHNNGFWYNLGYRIHCPSAQQ